MNKFMAGEMFLRGVSLFFNILVEVFGEDFPAERTCQNRFARLKRGDFFLEDP